MTSINEIVQRVKQLESKTNHLIVRSELTLYVLSVMIEAGVVKREGVEELVRDAEFNAPDISQAIIAKEKEIVSTLLNKVKISLLLPFGSFQRVKLHGLDFAGK